MATLHYGRHRITLDDGTAHLVARLIVNIVGKGATEWLSLQMEDGDAVDFLITAGVPVTVSFDDPEGSQAHLDLLIEQYLREEVAEQESGDESSS
jgi:hypothetical protein